MNNNEYWAYYIARLTIKKYHRPRIFSVFTTYYLAIPWVSSTLGGIRAHVPAQHFGIGTSVQNIVLKGQL